MNFFNAKTRKTITLVIVGIVVLALLLEAYGLFVFNRQE